MNEGKRSKRRLIKKNAERLSSSLIHPSFILILIPHSSLSSTSTSSASSASSSASSSSLATMSLITSKTISLAVADEIASLAIKAAISHGFNPISICVMDPAGAEIVTKRMDGCPPSAYPKISHAKANTCVAVKSSSRAYGLKYLIGKDGVSPVGAEVFARVLNQISITGGNMAAFQGGVLIREKGSGII